MTVHPEHVELGGSNAKRWMNCAGSILMCRGLPNKPNEHSAKGTCVHKIAESWLRHALGLIDWIEYPLGSKISADGFTFRVDQAMLDGAQVYLDYIKDILCKYPHAKTYVEESCVINDEMRGRLDCGIVVPFDRAFVIDYKNGYGEVDVEWNEQLLYYAVGLLKNNPSFRMLETLVLTIVQPNGASGQKIKEFECSIDEVLKFEAKLLAAAEATKIENSPQLNANDEWCKWCPAQAKCPAYKELTEKNIGIEFKDLPLLPVPRDINSRLPAPYELSPAQIRQFLTVKDSVEKWFEGIASYAKGILEDGTEEQKAAMIEQGFHLEPKLGNRRYIDEPGVLSALASTVASYNTNVIVQEFIKTDLISPAQLEKKLKALKIEFDLEKYVERPDNGTALKMAPH